MRRLTSAAVKYARIALVVGILAAGAALFTLYLHVTRLQPLDVIADPVGARAQFDSYIGVHGTKSTYAALKRAYNGELPNERHNAAHLFGGLVYAADGPDGVVVCDDDYNYGCYHGFLLSAVASEGLESLPDLNAVCLSMGDDVIKCQHGLGHGILEYLGHVRLNEAIDVCSSEVPAPDAQGDATAIDGCLTGVFMQYNVADLLNPRPLFEGASPYNPCFSVRGEARQACLYQLPAWWYNTLGDFAKLGSLCDELEERVDAEVCTLGIAKIAARSAAFDADGTVALCRALPSGRQDFCILYAAITVKSFYKGTLSEALCARLPDTKRDSCRKRIGE